jgi:hypothetical protein
MSFVTTTKKSHGKKFVFHKKVIKTLKEVKKQVIFFSFAISFNILVVYPTSF